MLGSANFLKRMMIAMGLVAAMMLVAAPGIAPAFAQTPDPGKNEVNNSNDTIVTGVIQPAAPSAEGPSHIITEEITGEEFGIFSDAQGVDLTRYEGQAVTINGIFQTQGEPLSSFSDLSGLLIYVTGVDPIGEVGPEPVAEPGGEPDANAPDQYDNGDGTSDQYQNDGATPDQYEDDSTVPSTGNDSPDGSSGASSSGSGGGLSVLPDTGGASLLALGAGALLVAGGLIARRMTSRL
jgi:hypothetical protein